MSAYNEQLSLFDTLKKIGKCPKFYDDKDLKAIKGRLGAFAWADIKKNGDKSHFYLKHKYYTFLLYPDNPAHAWLYEYFLNYGFQGFLAILHKGDSSNDDLLNMEEGGEDAKNTCKPHYHCIVCYNYSKSFWSALCSLEHYGVFYAQPVSSVQDLVIYFLHKTPEAIAQGKEPYNFEDLVYNGCFVNIVDKLRLAFGDSASRVSPYLLLLRYSQCCDSKLDFYAYAMSNPVLDDFLRKHQLIFENLLKERFIFNNERR